uniref:Uncharacterized protein n=1 Tax=viral metagenome TaxID=1070528 RepID=A0A6M3KTN4_9ZZZZ
MPNLIPPFTAASDRGYKFLRVFDQYYVSRGGRAVLYVEGGIAPYDWVVTGTDFTLDAAQTAVQYNFIDVDAAATIDNTETVTVTDANGESVTIVACTCNITVCSATLDSCSATPLTSALGCTTAVVTLVGGCPPYHWVISAGVGTVKLAAEYTNKPVNKVTCIDDDCYDTGCYFSVTVTDANNDSVVCGLGCLHYSFSIDQDNSDDTIDSSTPATVTVIGPTAGPYTWAITGTGYTIVPEGSSNSLSAVVTVVGGACGAAADYSPYCTVSVTDACNNTVTWNIRCTNAGVGTPGWSAGYTNGCPCGEHDDAVCTYSAPNWYCVLSLGIYKTTEVLQLHSPGSPTCETVVNYPNAGDTVKEYCAYYCNQQGYAAYVPCLESSPTLSWCGINACDCCVRTGLARCTIPQSIRYQTWECS